MNSDQKIELLVSELAILLIQQSAVLISAESCTGGWVAKKCTDMAGSSAWYEGGVVTYSNALKHSLLNVSYETLGEKGAVSEATAEAMALGACHLSHLPKTSYGLSVTGIAGPGGGTDVIPVGSVCFAWAQMKLDQDPTVLRSESCYFEGDRNAIRKQSVAHVLKQLVKQLRSNDAQ